MSANDTPHAITDEAIPSIKDYCTNRNYKCNGCRFSIKYFVPDYKGYATCIFANCPCTWDITTDTIAKVEHELYDLEHGTEVVEGKMTIAEYCKKKKELLAKLIELRKGNY